MPTPTKRKLDGLEFSAGNTREVRLQKSFLEQGLVIRGNYTATVTADATTVRAIPVPIVSISIVADGGKVLHSYRPGDMVREQLIYEQTGFVDQIIVPAGVTAAGGPYTGQFALQLPFQTPFANEGDATNLPTWIYDELILRVEWGNHAQLFVGGTGSVAMDSLEVVQSGLQGDFSQLGNPHEWGRRLLRKNTQFKEVASAAGADAAFVIEIPRTADIRSLMIITEDANGEPVDTIGNAFTLEVDNTLRQFSNVSRQSLKAENAKVFGVSMPAGVVVMEFAEDKDIIPPEILQARKMTNLNLIIDKAAVAGTIRVVTNAIEVPALSA